MSAAKLRSTPPGIRPLAKEGRARLIAFREAKEPEALNAARDAWWLWLQVHGESLLDAIDRMAVVVQMVSCTDCDVSINETDAIQQGEAWLCEECAEVRAGKPPVPDEPPPAPAPPVLAPYACETSPEGCPIYIEAKPCPACHSLHLEQRKMLDRRVVVCGCGWQGPPGTTPAEAMRRWNDRESPPVIFLDRLPSERGWYWELSPTDDGPSCTMRHWSLYDDEPYATDGLPGGLGPKRAFELGWRWSGPLSCPPRSSYPKEVL